MPRGRRGAWSKWLRRSGHETEKHFICLNRLSVHQQHQHLPSWALNKYRRGLLWLCVGALEPWHCRKALERKLVFLHLVPRLPVWESRTNETSHAVKEKSRVEYKKQKKQIRCASEYLLRNSSDTGYSLLDILSVWLRCVFRDTSTFSEGLWRKLSKPRSFIFSGPSAFLSSAGGFPSCPFALLSRLLLPTPSAPLPQEKNTHTGYSAALK